MRKKDRNYDQQFRRQKFMKIFQYWVYIFKENILFYLKITNTIFGSPFLHHSY